MPLPPAFTIALLVLLLVAVALGCVTAVILACVRRKVAARGFLRAGAVQFGLEVEPGPPDGGEAGRSLHATPIENPFIALSMAKGTRPMTLDPTAIRLSIKLLAALLALVAVLLEFRR